MSSAWDRSVGCTDWVFDLSPQAFYVVAVTQVPSVATYVSMDMSDSLHTERRPINFVINFPAISVHYISKFATKVLLNDSIKSSGVSFLDFV